MITKSHPLAPLHPALGIAGGAESANLAGLVMTCGHFLMELRNRS